jgi:hypothetical protein
MFLSSIFIPGLKTLPGVNNRKNIYLRLLKISTVLGKDGRKA